MGNAGESPPSTAFYGWGLFKDTGALGAPERAFKKRLDDVKGRWEGTSLWPHPNGLSDIISHCFYWFRFLNGTA